MKRDLRKAEEEEKSREKANNRDQWKQIMKVAYFGVSSRPASPLHKGNQRKNNFTLVKKQSRLDVRKFSFSQRTINVWNTLSEECVHASSVNMFKNRIDKYLVKAGYI